MSTIFISHPFSSDPAGNASLVARIARRLALQGHLPLAPHLLFPHFLDETVERHLAMKLCLELVAIADEVRVYGRMTPGMELEIQEALRLGIHVESERKMRVI